MEAVHGALRPTRGAAAAVALLEPQSERCSFCGIGNISASIRSAGTTRSMVSHNGILGHQVRKIQEFQYPFPRGSLLIMHSDGISHRWTVNGHDGLQSRHPAVIAAVLHRDHTRGRDDSTVVVIRRSSAAAGGGSR
jgi:serine phosphatase RsbU (regulator of sigma subunit)